MGEDKMHHFKATGVFYVKVSTDLISEKEPTPDVLRSVLKQYIREGTFNTADNVGISVGDVEMFTLINKMR